MSSRRQRSIPLGGRFRQVSLYLYVLFWIHDLTQVLAFTLYVIARFNDSDMTKLGGACAYGNHIFVVKWMGYCVGSISISAHISRSFYRSVSNSTVQPLCYVILTTALSLSCSAQYFRLTGRLPQWRIWISDFVRFKFNVDFERI